MPALTAQQVVTCVRRSADFDSADAIARDLGVRVGDVQDVLRQYGWPNPDALARAADVLERGASAQSKVDERKQDKPPARTLSIEEARARMTAGPPPKRKWETFDKSKARAPQPPKVSPVSQPIGVPTSSGHLAEVPLYLIEPDPDNPRATVDGIEGLAQSIAENGLLQPLVARQSADEVTPEHPLILVAGHRRYAALVSLGRATAPVIVRAQMKSDDVLAAMLVENSQRRDLDPIDEARGIKHLMATRGDELGTHARVAKSLGRSQKWVSDRLALLELSPVVQDKVRAGEVTQGEAVQLSRVNSGRTRAPRAGANNYHLASAHPLAERARTRCKSNHHIGYRVGQVACGECWEAVIRADERTQIHEHSATKGVCATCGKDMT